MEMEMEIVKRQGKGRSSRGSVMSRAAAALGKENIWPPEDGSSRDANVPTRESRSPLPEGFPRAPLQDITHILSPLNALPDGDVQDERSVPGDCRARRKRTKCKGISQSSSSLVSCEPDFSASPVGWAGLVQCETIQAAGGKAQSEAVVEVRDEQCMKTVSREQGGPQTRYVGYSSLSKERPSPKVLQKRRRQVESSSSYTNRANSRPVEVKTRSSILKFR